MNNLMEFARNRLEESASQCEDICSLRYWVGYIDALRAASKKLVCCDDCSHGGHCQMERIFRSEGIERPFCCRGKAGEQDG